MSNVKFILDQMHAEEVSEYLEEAGILYEIEVPR